MEIMIPLAATREELAQVREELEPVARQTLEAAGQGGWCGVGDDGRAAPGGLVAGEIAEVAEFFSFGTNDLTQTAFGFSRDDIGKFLGLYEERKLVPANPFVTIDVAGVGRLMEIASREGRQTRPSLKLGSAASTAATPTRSVLPHPGAGLCVLLAVPGPHRPPRRRTGSPRHHHHRLQVSQGRL